LKPSSANRSSGNRAAAAALGVLLPFLLAAGQAPSQSFPNYARVGRVVDGDTIILAEGPHVRYIGIDTPEPRRRDGGRWVDDPEPFAREATDANRRLVDGRRVRLEYDVETHDRYGRLLAYVYVAGPDGRELFVNAELLRQGMAQQLTIPPNVKFAQEFRAIAAEARQAKRGLWSVR